MSETEMLIDRIDHLASAVRMLAQALGSRINREQLAERIGIHRNTLRARVKQKGFPKPCSDGKWLLSEIIAWEQTGST